MKRSATRILAFSLLGLTSVISAATLQQEIAAARPNETISIERGVHSGPITHQKTAPSSWPTRRRNSR